MIFSTLANFSRKLNSLGSLSNAEYYKKLLKIVVINSQLVLALVNVCSRLLTLRVSLRVRLGKKISAWRT